MSEINESISSRSKQNKSYAWKISEQKKKIKKQNYYFLKSLAVKRIICQLTKLMVPSGRGPAESSGVVVPSVV